MSADVSSGAEAVPTPETEAVVSDADKPAAEAEAEVARAEEIWPPVLEYPERPTRAAYDRFRRMLDLVAVGLLAVPATVIVGLAAIALKVESPRAPVFYRQMRTGYRTERFEIIKLRTMVPNADALKASLAADNMRSGPDFKVARDPRITRIGRVLRRTSIDELPQLANILRGDMTLIGPRPTSLDVDAYEPWQLERFEVRPGVAGLWQAEARDSESWDERIALDIAYARRRCFRLDVRILFSTLRTVVRGVGST